MPEDESDSKASHEDPETTTISTPTTSESEDESDRKASDEDKETTTAGNSADKNKSNLQESSANVSKTTYLLSFVMPIMLYIVI